jgi:hypothetical protein
VSLVAKHQPSRGRSQRLLLVSVGTTFHTDTAFRQIRPPLPRAELPTLPSGRCAHRGACSLGSSPASADVVPVVPGGTGEERETMGEEMREKWR